MARRPFFTGDYGSALGRIDTRPIMEAGRAQAQMYAGLGAEAAKAIDTYQLNKERQKKDRATIKSTVDFLKMQKGMPGEEMRGDLYEAMMEGLTNEDVSLRERAMRAEQGLKNFTLGSQINASQALAKSRIEAADLQTRIFEQEEEAKKLKKEETEKLFTGLKTDLIGVFEDVEEQVNQGKERQEVLDGLNPYAKSLLFNARNIHDSIGDPNDYRMSYRDMLAIELDADKYALAHERHLLEKSKLEAEDQSLLPQFTTLQEAQDFADSWEDTPGATVSINSVPGGFEAKVNITFDGEDKDQNDLKPIPGHPNLFSFGNSATIYEKDANGNIVPLSGTRAVSQVNAYNTLLSNLESDTTDSYEARMELAKLIDTTGRDKPVSQEKLNKALRFLPDGTENDEYDPNLDTSNWEWQEYPTGNDLPFSAPLHMKVNRIIKLRNTIERITGQLVPRGPQGPQGAQGAQGRPGGPVIDIRVI
jgi:hypothetical protein